jgi:hypothetical protein
MHGPLLCLPVCVRDSPYTVLLSLSVFLSMCVWGCKVCRLWRRFAGDVGLWRELLDRTYSWWIATDEWQTMVTRANDDAGLWKTSFARLWSLQRNWTSGRCSVRTYEGHTSHISCLQFDETRIVSGSSDHSIRYGVRLSVCFFVSLSVCACVYARIHSASVWALARSHVWAHHMAPARQGVEHAEQYPSPPYLNWTRGHSAVPPV